MPTPANRSKLLPARGTYAALEASLPDLLDGEMVFATDERVYYQVEAGALVSVNAQATITTEQVETVEGATRRGLRDVIPPEIPAGWTELVNQRETNWWLHNEVENVANRTTNVEQQQRSLAERVYDLENIESPANPEGDLNGYATIVYVNDADKLISDRVTANKDQIEKLFVGLEEGRENLTWELQSYAKKEDAATKDELNAASARISGNTKEIEELQVGFDAALLAAQEGSENLMIELQSYAKKADAATKEELATVHSQLKLADSYLLQASQATDALQGKLIAANTEAIEANAEAIAAIVIPEVPEIDLTQALVGTGEQPADPVEGQEWMDPNTLTTMVFWRGAWVPCAPAYGGGSGDGSGGGIPAMPTLEDVLDADNLAKPGQGIRFRVSKGDLPPTAKAQLDFDAGAGLRLGGVVSYYSINEPFSLDTDNGATVAAFATRRMTAVDDYYYASINGESVSAGLGITGINYNTDNCQVDVNSGGVLIRFGDYDNPSLKISASTYEGKSTITADEFIGDGSRLTNTFSVGEGVKQTGNRIEVDQEWLADKIKELIEKYRA